MLSELLLSVGFVYGISFLSLLVAVNVRAVRASRERRGKR